MFWSSAHHHQDTLDIPPADIRCAAAYTNTVMPPSDFECLITGSIACRGISKVLTSPNILNRVARFAYCCHAFHGDLFAESILQRGRCSKSGVLYCLLKHVWFAKRTRVITISGSKLMVFLGKVYYVTACAAGAHEAVIYRPHRSIIKATSVPEEAAAL